MCNGGRLSVCLSTADIWGVYVDCSSRCDGVRRSACECAARTCDAANNGRRRAKSLSGG
jgi:hypothetical protein